MKYELLISLIFSWENWGPERLKPKVLLSEIIRIFILGFLLFTTELYNDYSLNAELPKEDQNPVWLETRFYEELYYLIT